MPQMTGGQALVQQLKMEGFDTIFCLPGIQLDWAFDAIYAEQAHFRVIHTRHETSPSRTGSATTVSTACGTSSTTPTSG